MDIFSIEIGKKVKETRNKKKFNQEYLGGLVGRTRVTIVNIEAGRQGIPLQLLYRLAIALEVEIAELLPSKEWFEKNKDKKVRIKKIIEIYE